MEEIPSKENAVLSDACQKILSFHWLAKSHMLQKRITGSSFVKLRERRGELRKVRDFFSTFALFFRDKIIDCCSLLLGEV